MRVLWLVPLGIAAFGADLSGKWQVHRSAAGRESTQECTLAQKGGELSGNCKGDRGTVEVKGKVEGNHATWTYTAESEGGTVTVVYKGTVESEKKISGTVTAVEFSVEGEFTATRLN